MEETVEARKTFNEILLESIDEVLTAIGNSVKSAVYFHLQNNFGISKDQIIYRMDDFVNTLQSIFGVGARHIELQLVRQIEAKTAITYPFPIQAISLQDYVVFIRQEYER